MELYYYILWANKCPHLYLPFFLDWITIKKSKSNPIKKQLERLNVPIQENTLNNVFYQLDDLEKYYKKIILRTPIEVNGKIVPTNNVSDNFEVMIKLKPNLLLIVSSDYKSLFFEVRKIIETLTPVHLKTKTDKTSIISKETNILIDNVLIALQNAIGKKFKGKKSRSVINSRTKEGFILEDFLYVIQNQGRRWIGNEYEIYMRPETLFGNKMEGYVNAPKFFINPESKNEKIYQEIEKAKQHDWTKKN